MTRINSVYYSNMPERDFNRSTKISLKHKYVYFAIGKIANSTVNYCLQQVEYQNTPFKVESQFDWRRSPHIAPFQLGAEIWGDIVNSKEYRKLAFVRNPYSRLLSCYLDRMQDPESMSYKNISVWLERDCKGLDFADFVKVISEQSPVEMDSHWRPQVYEVHHGEIELDRIFYFEALPHSLEDLSEYLFGEVKPVFKSDPNRSPSVTSAASLLQSHYNQELFDKVYGIYERDFETFGYNRDPGILYADVM